jgi:hypothetical protein
MDNNIKATTLGTLHSDMFFDRKVSVSFDSIKFDPTADFKVLVQIEPPTIMNLDKTIIENKNNFDLILSWNPEILNNCTNSELFPFGSCWINDADRGIHEKNKEVSIIASNKKQTDGHRLRHNIISRNTIPMDTFGNGYKPVDNKIIALKDYRFSLIIENDRTSNWFTEKIIDCLVTGTVPVYWGCANIGDFFNTDGFIRFNSIEELNTIAPMLNNETYIKMLPFINENFNLSLKYADFWERVESTIKNKLL